MNDELPPDWASEGYDPEAEENVSQYIRPLEEELAPIRQAQAEERTLFSMIPGLTSTSDDADRFSMDDEDRFPLEFGKAEEQAAAPAVTEQAPAPAPRPAPRPAAQPSSAPRPAPSPASQNRPEAPSMLSRIFSGQQFQSNNRPVIEKGQVNWGDPQNPADFVRANAAMTQMLGEKPAEGPKPAARPQAMSYAPTDGRFRSPAMAAIDQQRAATAPRPSFAFPGIAGDLSSSATYARAGEPLKDVNGIIFHHTAGGGKPADIVNVLNQRGLGVQYVMDRDGSVYMTLPDGSRGAHMRPSQVAALDNSNTIGVEMIARDNDDVTPAQVAASRQLFGMLRERFPKIQPYGHGEVNQHKQTTEGMAAVQSIRSAYDLKPQFRTVSRKAPGMQGRTLRGYQTGDYADGGRVEDGFPTHFMPNVGRQVMEDGGVPDDEYAMQIARDIMGPDPAPAVRQPREDLEARLSAGQQAMLSQIGVMLPNKAADIKEDDSGSYPVDAEGNRLNWMKRPFWSFATKDEGENRYGLPYVLDVLTAGTGGGGMAAPVKGGGTYLGSGPILKKADTATDVAAGKAAAAAPDAVENAISIARREPSGMPKDEMLTGSMNPLENVPFTYKGKNPRDWTPEEFAEVGSKFGVENLGPASKPEVFKDTAGREFNIPGGLEGKFTYYDLLDLKKQGIDPSKVDRDLHTKLQQKILRTMTPENVSDEQVWSGLIFGMTSPNNPLFPNQLSQSRLRLRDPKMIDDLADMISWQPGEVVSKEARKVANDQIAHNFGLDAASKGGLGTRGSADYTRVAELAKMFKERPDFFRKSPDEPWDNFVERVSSQVAGLSMKTGSFGSVWQDPATAAISAIDRHMAQQFERTGGLFKDEAQRMSWEARVVDRWNKDNPDRAVESFYDLRRTSGAEGHIGGLLLEYVGDAKTPKFRNAPKRGSNSMEGVINPDLPQHLKEADWVYEPEKVFKMGDAYKRALALNDTIAKEHGLGLFGSQWMEWDRIRRRLEPHENMFPSLEKMPAMSVDQLRSVDAEHRMSGHKDYTKVDQQGRALKDLPEDELPEGVFLKPTRPRAEASPFAYFSKVPASQIVEGATGSEREE